MSAPQLILASASPRRSDLLRQAGFDFRIVASAAEETASEDLSASEMAQINAYRKARAICKRFPDAVVLGADTVVALGARLFGKPADLAEAEQTLLLLQGRTHHVITGVCLIHLRAHRQEIFYDQTSVTFRPLTSAQARHYHTLVNPLDKAGAYGVQEHQGQLVESMDGSFSNVAGLPMEQVQTRLRAFGFSPPEGTAPK